MTTGDPEIDAMTAVAAALSPLDAEAQERVIKWTAGRFGVEVKPAKTAGRPARRTTTKTETDAQGIEPEDVDEDAVMAAVAEHTGVDVEKLERLFHIDGGSIKLLVNHSALGSSVSEKTRNTAQIITVIRKIGMGHADTAFDLIRQECERKHYYDAKNFAYKHMTNIEGFAVKGDGRGSKRLEARNSGINAFAALVDKVAGEA
jgi:hypothetical protein